MTTDQPRGASPSRPDENLRCAECDWPIREDREYHPYVACLIVKATGNDPLPYLREVGRFIPTLNAEGQLPREATDDQG